MTASKIVKAVRPGRRPAAGAARPPAAPRGREGPSRRPSTTSVNRQLAGPVGSTRREPSRCFCRSWARHWSRCPGSTRSMVASGGEGHAQQPQQLMGGDARPGQVPAGIGASGSRRRARWGRCRSRPHRPRPGRPAGRCPHSAHHPHEQPSWSVWLSSEQPPGCERSVRRRRAAAVPTHIPAGQRPMLLALLVLADGSVAGCPIQAGASAAEGVTLRRVPQILVEPSAGDSSNTYGQAAVAGCLGC
jgi:hypothetical protein